MARNKKQGDKYTAPFAIALRQTLEGKGVTQGELASLIGVTPQTVSQYCSGASEPSFDNLVKIADKLDVSVDYLLGRTADPNRQASAIDTLGISPKVVERLELYRSQEYADLFTEGLNILLSAPRLSIISKSIGSLVREIDKERKLQEQRMQSSGEKISDKRAAALSMTEKDAELSNEFVAAIEQAYPHLRGRVEVFCGVAVIESKMQHIVELIKGDLSCIPGYFDCVCGTYNG